VSGCTPRAGPRSARCAPIRPIAGRVRLVSAVAAGIADRGEKVFLHASAADVTAIRRYGAIGFQLRLVTRFHAIAAPGG